LDFFIQKLYTLDSPWLNSEHFFSIFQQVAILFVIAFLFSRSSAFQLLVKNSLRKRDWLLLYGIFSFISIMGSVLATNVPLSPEEHHWTQVDSRSIGAVLAGFLGGPVLGTAVGLTAGIYRYNLGGATDMAGFLGTTLTGMLSGLVYLLMVRKNQAMRFDWKIAVATVCTAELMMKALVFPFASSFNEALALIQITTLPSLIGNSIGAALFVTILNDRERSGASYTTSALHMAKYLVDVLKYGFNEQAAKKIVNTIRKETRIATVAITDHRNKIMAISGIGTDHHQVGDEIAADLIQKAIEQQRVIFIDGNAHQFQCPIATNCPLHSALIAPLAVDGNVLGVLLLFEPKRRFFPKLNRALGEGVADLLSEQMRLSIYQEQLAIAEHKLLIAQINPHYLANALNTVSAVMRTDTTRAKELLAKLAFLMRKNIKQGNETSTLEQELEHLDAHLSIELTRYGDKLQIEKSIEPELMNTILPSFSLQPIVENAIKHGTSRLLIPGIIHIHAYQIANRLIRIEIKDNAGQYQPTQASTNKGVGMSNVDGRIKELFGGQYGLSVDCEPNQYTTVTLTLPFRKQS